MSNSNSNVDGLLDKMQQQMAKQPLRDKNDNRSNSMNHRHSTRSRPLNADNDISNFNQVNYLEVTRNQHDQRIDNFLLARLKGMPRSHIYKMIRSDEVRVNNKRCKPYDKLERGDVVRIAPVQLATREKPVISDSFAQSLLKRVVYEDDGLIVLNKPSGIAVHGGSGIDFGVIEAMREVTGKKYLELVHRIDKETSGLLMIAKKRSALKVLQEHLRNKTIQKHYLAIAKGQPALNNINIDAPLLKYTLDSGERRVRVEKNINIHKTAKPSQTVCNVLSRFQLVENLQQGLVSEDAKGLPVSLIEAMPLTGRTHQIRVHLAGIGHAILGDSKYNTEQIDIVRRLCLHAWKLEIPQYPLITAPLPKDMQVLLPEQALAKINNSVGIE